MAIICLSPCSSSSLKRFLLSPSSSFNDHHETLPRSLCFLKCDSENHCGLCRINQRKHFELKASNLQPSNPVVVAGVPLDFSAAEHVKVASEGRCFHFFDTEKSESTLSIIVLGASGDLARTKIFPTLFGLFYKVRLPENFTIFRYARSVMTSKELGNMISRTLTCRIGNSSEEHYLELDSKLKEKEARRLSNRLFYLAIPPNVSLDVVRCARRRASSENGWTRFIVEKPFGYDLESSRELTRDIKQYLSEDQIFRYFDDYGIIRDVMQNHLLQILALFSMETPISLNAEDIRNEKVKVLRSMRPVKLEDVILGQYKGYIDKPCVSDYSITPTFTAATLFVNNSRWDGVPFLLIAGKALQSNRAEIRVQYKHVPGNLYNRKLGTYLDKSTNELVIRVQPEEAMYLKINSNVPGLGMRLDHTDINLLYKSRCPREIPDAYERKLLDAIEGERRSFVRSDELDAAWEVFTPLLKELERKKVVPELYSCGSTGPVGVHYLASKHNVHYKDYL